jgi:hypothetical protein
MQLVALTGSRGCGKSEVARILVQEHGYTRMRFADGLKRMLKAIGLTDAQVDGHEKEIFSEMLGGKTPRWAMQSLGTEWGRDCISKDLWVNVTRNDIVAHLVKEPAARIVIDDCRFPNEEEMINNFGGQLWRVRRPGKEAPPSKWPLLLAKAGFYGPAHSSEYWWSRLPVKREVLNDKDLVALSAQIWDIMKEGNPCLAVPAPTTSPSTAPLLPPISILASLKSDSGTRSVDGAISATTM